MKTFEALFIKYLRVRREFSYRKVAAKWTDRYVFLLPFNDEATIGKNQEIGIKLCDEAMEFLGETEEQGWN